MDASFPPWQNLLDRSTRRLRWVAGVARIGRVGLAVGLAAGLLAAALRLGGFWDISLAWPELLAAWGLVLLLTLATTPRPPARHVAHRVDRSLGARDLFLALTDPDIGQSPYADGLRQEADLLAAAAKPQRIIPFAPHPHLPRLGLGLLASLLALGWVPLRDPFGLREQDRKLEETRKAMDQQQKLAAQAREALADERLQNAELTRQSLEDLLAVFKQLDPLTPQKNGESLRAARENLNQAWQKLREQSAGKTAAASAQQFGYKSELAKALEKDLKQGSTQKLQDAVASAMAKAEAAANAKTEGERQAAIADLQKELSALRDAAQANPELAKIAAQLEQAVNQGNLAGVPQLSEQALQAVQEALQNAQAAGQNLGQALQQMQQLEQAMQAAQNAQQCNAQGMGKPGEGQSPSTLDEYATMYQQMLQAQGGGGAGMGMGMQGPGTGEGGKAPEKPDEQMSSQATRVNSDFRPRDIIASWKTEGEAERGEQTKDYEHTIPTRPQEVSEAILREQIPAGYHQGIRDFFQASQPTQGPE